MMKKLVFIFCISLFAFSFLSCERNVDIYEDTSMQIKKIIRVTKPREVKEYRYKNQYIYRFASPVDGLYYVLYDKKGNFIKADFSCISSALKVLRLSRAIFLKAFLSFSKFSNLNPPLH